MLVKVNTSLAGANFSFRFGEEVEQDVFAAYVGNGWDALCEPVGVEKAIDAVADEAAVEVVAIETADAPPAAERRGRRK